MLEMKYNTGERIDSFYRRKSFTRSNKLELVYKKLVHSDSDINKLLSDGMN